MECKFVVDKEYIAEYNADNGTNFKVLPEGTYTVPEMVTLPNGTTNMELEVTINGDQLVPGDYMLPVKIAEVSQFEISAAKVVSPLAFRVMGHKLDRAGWTQKPIPKN